MSLKFSMLTGEESQRFPDLMKDAFRLRHRIFVEELGWTDLRCIDGMETDRFDDGAAIHMFLHSEKKLVAYQRLLPTINPYLLSEIYPHLCETDLPRDEAIWEWTRFAVEPGFRKGDKNLSPAGNIMLSGIVEWGLSHGVNQIVIELNPVWVLVLLTLHFRVVPLGIPKNIAGAQTLAVVAKFDERTLKRLKSTRAVHTSGSRLVT